MNEYSIHQYKNYVGTATKCTVEWEGQSDIAATTSVIYLQIYNRSTNEWDTLDSNTTIVANTDFIFRKGISDLTDYKSLNGYISCRVYQRSYPYS